MYLLMMDEELMESIKKAMREGKKEFHFLTQNGNHSLKVKVKPMFGEGRRVRVVETGEIFDSVAELAYTHDVSSSAIVTAIKEKRKCKGKTYRYVEGEYTPRSSQGHE